MGKICFDSLQASRGIYKEQLHESLMVLEENPRIVHLDELAAGSIRLEGDCTDSLYPYRTFLARRTGKSGLVWLLHCDKDHLQDLVSASWSVKPERQVQGFVLCLS